MFGFKKKNTLLQPVKVGKLLEKSWGTIECLDQGENYRIDKLTIGVGSKDKFHAQPSCRHMCYVVSGVGVVRTGPTLKNLATSPITTDTEFVINNDWIHQYENVGATPLVIIQSSYGKYTLEEMVHEL